MTTDESYKQQISQLFGTYRSTAIRLGARMGYFELQVDAMIGDLYDADVLKMQNASDDECRNFAAESGEVVKRFVAKL